MDFDQLVLFLFANLSVTFALFIWSRSESKNDIRMMLRMIQAIQDEMKDFHGRLCSLGERIKK